MSDVEIKGKISFDASLAAKQMTDLNKIISDQKKIWKESKEGSEEYLAAQKKIADASKQYNDILAQQNEAQGKSGEAFGILKEKINAMVPGLEGAQSGVKSLGAELKILLVNPIVLFLTAIVAVLALVYKAFTNTFEGGEKMEQIFAGIKAAGQSLIDSLEKIGKAAKDFLTLHWGDAADEIRGVAKAAGEAYNAMAQLTEEAQGLHKEQLANDLDHAERQKRLAILREQAAEEADPKKRKAALLELKKDAEQNSKDDIDLSKRTTENKIKQLTLQKDGELKNRDEINELKIKQINVETDNANELRRIGKQLTAADKAEIAERKEAEKAQDEANKKRIAEAKANMAELLKLQDETFKHSISKQDLAILLLEQRYKKEQALLKKNHADTLLLENNFRRDLTAVIASGLKNEEVIVTKAVGIRIVATDTMKNAAMTSEQEISAAKAIGADIDKKLLKIKMAAIATEVEAYCEAAGAVAEIIGKQTVAGKILASASAIIHTLQGIAAGVKLGFPAAIPAIAIASATGYKTVKAINAVQIPGFSGGSTPTIPSIVAAPLAPQATSTSLNQSSINAVGNAAQGGVNRAFVLDADIRNNAERANRINRAARLG